MLYYLTAPQWTLATFDGEDDDNDSILSASSRAGRRFNVCAVG